METTINNGITYTYNQIEINNKIHSTIDSICKFIKENNYQVSGNIEELYYITWKHLSKRQMKKIQKYCFWIETKPTLRNINTFLCLLSRIFDLHRIKINISLKEDKIQKARKEWLKIRNLSDILLSQYKLEKGNFYKK